MKLIENITTVCKLLDEIEDYTGKNYIEVQTILERNYGLNVTVEKKEPTDSDKEYDEQEIIGQSLAAGSEVKKGDSIILYIPDIVDKFPDMNAEGWSIEDVEAFCDKYNLVLEKKYQASTKDAPGKIIDQSRAPGSPIYEGRTLTVTIATEPEPASNTTTDKDNDKTDSNS